MGTIPRPRKVSRRINIYLEETECLASQMELSKTEANRELYREILNTLGTLCDRYCPHQKVMDLPSKALLIEEAIQIHPILKTYENCWPISTILTMHRQFRKSGHPDTGIMGCGYDVPSGDCQQKSRRSVTGSSPQKNGSSKAHLEMDRRRKSPPKSGYKAANRGTAASTTIANMSNTLAKKPPKDSGFIQQFLQGLAQDLSDLLPVFVGYGVGDENALRGLLRTEDWRRWLYGWVSAGQLTELQFKMVSDGLGAMIM